jgi:hypothetical protein
MRVWDSRSGIVLLVALLAVVATAVAEYSLFLAAKHGGGASSSKIAAASGRIGAVTISSKPVGLLYPVARLRDGMRVKVRVFNNGRGKQYVGTIRGVVANNAGCSGRRNFRVAPIAVPGLLTPGEHDYTSRVALIDNGANQDVCANKTFTINWSSAAG